MPHERLESALSAALDGLAAAGTRKGAEDIIVEVLPAAGGKGPRYRLEGDDRPYLRMNANSYLGLGLSDELRQAEEEAGRRYGVGPGAVRFISGTWAPHVELERRLAAFHGRQAAMIFSSAYAAIVGVLVPLITDETVIISDALNHNSIINAMRLARPADKQIYGHNDMAHLDAVLAEASGRHKRAIVISDGVFSMRGDIAPLAEIRDLAEKHDAGFAENVLVVIDDSHGVGAYGSKGRGTEEIAAARADLLVATLGKALGVNGGYVAASPAIIEFLREQSPLYIYSNPITAGEAAAASRALEIVDGAAGSERLTHLKAMTERFEAGLTAQGFETIASPHPIVPLLVRDTDRTAALVAHLRQFGILATGLNYPVVPKGDQTIRFQISADHTPDDIAEALDVLGSFSG